MQETSHYLSRCAPAQYAFRCLATLLLTAFLAAPTFVQAQDDCCEYLSTTLVPRADGECCFDVYVEVRQGIPCEITAVRIRVPNPASIASAGTTSGFTLTQNANVAIWDKGNNILDPGQNYVGYICIQDADPCVDVVVKYFDFGKQAFICKEIIEVCCEIDPPGNLKGTKFDDVNGNGVHDAGEPGLAGWQIVLRNKQTGALDTTTTDANGDYCFNDLTGASWCLYEIQQAGWTQTAPAGVTYSVTLNSGQTINDLDFGNKVICSNPEKGSELGGVKDNFSTANGAEPSSPSADLLGYIAEKYPNSNNNFDGTTIDRSFGHSFTNFLPEGCCVVGATLKIHARTNNSTLSDNDAIHIVENGERVWSAGFSAILGYNWENASDTVCLDLANLPVNAPSNVLAALQDGDLDIFIQDDTSIDWMELTVEYCCPKSECCEYLEPELRNREECCFDFYVTVAQGIPCEITGARITALSPATIGATTAEPGYTVSDNGVTATWDKGGNILNTGANFLGQVCFEGVSPDDPCFQVVVEYFDFNTQEWVCCDTLDLCCEIDPPGSLKGTKFDDVNGNGVQDAGEPGLAGFEIIIRDKTTNTYDTTTTDANGDYCFTDLTGADWCVYETQQSGWVQTAPKRSFHSVTLTAGQTINDLDFGNKRVCEDPETGSELGGNKDNFATSDGAEPAGPSTDLSEYINRIYPGGTEPNFDGTVIDRIFGHSFTNFLPEGCCIVGATLKIHVRTNNSGLSFNDNLIFAEDGEYVWSARIGTILGVNWVNTSDTICLDLANLPVRLPSNVLSTLQDGDFDFAIQDDTGVDWAELTVEYCCPKSECCEYLEPQLTIQPDQDCCFDFSVEVEQDIPCEITQSRITALAPATISSASAASGFNVSHNATVATWDKGGAIFDPGTNNLGDICFENLDPDNPCATVIVEYFDFNVQEWVCCDTLVVCCKIDPPGELKGMKFHDKNCNGVKDQGEPGLEGWEITITDKQTGDTQSQFTDADGNYCFTDLSASSWCIAETWQSGWVQTFPASVDYSVVLGEGESITGLDFGNVEICEDPQSGSELGGVKDNFSTANGAEPASPSTDLREFMGAVQEPNFDGTVINRWFGHSFTNFLPDGCCIVGATLKIHLRTNNSGLSYNDHLHFVEDGERVWNDRIGNILGYTWVNASDTLCLDLANLPNRQPSNILATLQDGDFDFAIQDDTGVDWAELTVQYCCPEESACCEYLDHTLKAIQGSDCCFDLSVTVTQGIPCEITAVRVTALAPASISSSSASSGFSVTNISSTVSVWNTTGGGVINPGFNSVGKFCLKDADPCASIIIDYFDFNTQEWVCAKTVQACCASGLPNEPVNVEPGLGSATGEILELTAAPNPAFDQATISYELGQASNVRMVLYNALGEEIRTLETGMRSAGIHTYNLQLGDLAGGAYFVQLTSGTNSSVTAPLTVQR